MTDLINSGANEKVQRCEEFINNVLKEQLREMHDRLEKYNTELAEWLQLRSVLTNVQDSETFKTKMDIGTNIYVQAEVEDTSKVLINVGLGVYVEFALPEALKYIDFRTKVLNKQCDVVKNESARLKAKIKIVLLGIKELSNIK